MDCIEPFEDLESLTLPPNALIGLKEGLAVQELNEGTSFEVDPTIAPPSFKDSDEPYAGEEVWPHLNHECLLGNDDDDNDEDNYEEYGDEQSPFLRLEKTMKPLTKDSGVLKKIRKLGVGDVVPEGSVVRVHYNGYLEYSDEPYDSSRLRNKPLQFRLGQQEVVTGLDVGVASMRKSEIARIMVKPEYAFGKMGCPPRIPPDATILFEVELLGFHEYQPLDDSTSKGGEKQMTLQEKLNIARAEKESGNDFFEQKIYSKAAQRYSKAIRILEEVRLKNEEEEKEWSVVLVKLYLNLSLCDLRQSKAPLTIAHCRRVLELDSKNVKAWFRIGQAYMMLCEWSKSREHLLKALHLAPTNGEIRAELVKLERKMAQFAELERSKYSGMFGAKGASSKAGPPKEAISEETRKSYRDKILTFKDNMEVREMLISVDYHHEVKCIEEIAQELELIVQNGFDGLSVKIIKPDIKPDV